MPLALSLKNFCLFMVNFYDNIITSSSTELHFSFLKMQENFCGWVLDYFLLPGNFSEKKTVNALTTEVTAIFIPGGGWNFTFKSGFSQGILV